MTPAIVVILGVLAAAILQAQPQDALAGARDAVSEAAATDALFRALRASDMRTVRAALARGADINGRSELGETPLMYVTVYSTVASLEALLEGGADPNARDKRGGTALMRSVRDVERVRLLIAAGADVNAKGELGVTALMTAASRPGSSDVVKLLLAHKADPGTPDDAGVPPLMYATNFGDLESVKALVAAGAGVDSGRRNGATPLFWASNGPNDVLVWLLQHKGDPNGARGTGAGRTPLMEAAFFGATDNVRSLLDWGADVNAESERGTALIWAAGSDRADAPLIRLLLERGADPNAVASRCERCIHEPRAEDGSTDLTALMLARQRGETEIVRMLVAAGARR